MKNFNIMNNSLLYHVDSSLYNLSIRKLTFDDNSIRYGLEISTSSTTGKLLFKSYDACRKFLVEIQYMFENSYLVDNDLPF